jgi:Ca-activated chloride channel family protein
MRLIGTALLAGAVAIGWWTGFSPAEVELPPLEQSATAGVIAGVVVDANGAAMPGVAVELLRSGAAAQATKTNARGEFAFRGLAAGVYEVRAQREGLVPASVRVAVTDAPVPTLRLSLGIRAAAAEDAQHGTIAPLQMSGVVPPPSPAAPGRVAGQAGRGVAMGGIAATSPAAAKRAPLGDFNREAYGKIDDNRFRRVTDQPVSTFSIDVDTASYSNVRRFLNAGTLPPADAVRTEELINYFRFSYASPRDGAPVGVTTEIAACPWNSRHKLALVGVQAPRHEQHAAPVRNLVFLLDVSGSMMSPDKLPLVKTAMRMLVDTLTAQDRVAIVVYAGASGLSLPSTPGDRKADIHRAIEELRAGGSTNGAAGIQLAYNTAASSFVTNGVNRVILATDGDFNVGVTSEGELVRLIERERERGIFLSVLGVGTGNLNDSTMEKLADKGNGNYSYLDSLHEARRVLIEEAGATLVTVAKDVKIQIEFNPRVVGAYRLIGYENRVLNREDFNDDTKDAGEIGSGHTVTALYEIVPAGEPPPGVAVDPLVYQDQPRPNGARSGDLMTLKLRYKTPTGSTSQLLTIPVANSTTALTANIGFAAAVAEFGMLLRNSEFKGQATWRTVQELARQHKGTDPDGYRAEFIRLVDLAAALDSQRAGTR